jgi:hypothetical protein
MHVVDSWTRQRRISVTGFRRERGLRFQDTLQVILRNSGVLKVNECSTTPVVFNSAFKISTGVLD